MTGINFQTGYVISIIDPDHVGVEFPNAAIAGVHIADTGIAQYLTNRSDVTRDCLRWYDGDPTDGNPTTPGFVQGKGWVNFAPPLSQGNFSIDDTAPLQYYLVGARQIVPFKDRLLFFGPVIQTSAPTIAPIYLQDAVIYSQNGTAFYTCSFTGDPLLPTTQFFPILVPDNQSATATAYWEDQTGFGGFAVAGIDQPINTVSPNKDVLILGYNSIQQQFVYTANDISPFLFYTINSELGSGSTFSQVNMDQGVITRGTRGYIITNQTQALRIDPEIPDQVFEIQLIDNGTERFCAQRDYINEWIYFTYPSNMWGYKFPTQTLLYNYRDDSWAIFNECYTTYGTFRKQTGFTWGTVGFTYPTWASWNDPWDAGQSTLLNPQVIGGNQQGFVIIKGIGSDEDPLNAVGEQGCLYIRSFSSSQITSPDHCLNDGDYIIINGCLGTVGTQVNGKIFSVSLSSTNTFVLNPPISSGTYLGNGNITRMYVPQIQTKQFPTSWGLGRKTRIGVQQYLLTATAISQITLLIFLSQDADNAWNSGNIVPQGNVDNGSLIYSTILYTCPESTNLGLTPANVNLQMISLPSTGASAQKQIWHRVNTSLIGDTVQLGFTLSDAQMRAVNDDGQPISQFSEIELHSIIMDLNPSQMLS